jgi:hypothetical protein
LNSKQSTPPKIDIKKIILLDPRGKLKKSRDHGKIENQKSVKIVQQRSKKDEKFLHNDVILVSSQNVDLKKSGSTKVCKNGLDREKLFDTLVSRSLDPKHKISKSDAMCNAKKAGSSANLGKPT